MPSTSICARCAGSRGELAGDEVRFETKHSVLPFAAGNRVQFTDTLKAARLYNGNVGTITAIDPGTGEIGPCV